MSVRRLATGWTVRRSNPGGGKIIRNCPDWPWGPHRLLYIGYRVFFTAVKRLGCGVDHPPPSRTEVDERVELHLHSSFGLSWQVQG